MRLHIIGLTIFALIFSASLTNLSAQRDPPERAMISDEFANSRPSSSTGEANGNGASKTRPRPAAKSAQTKPGTAARRKDSYKLSRVEPPAFGRKSKVKPKIAASAAAPLRFEELGVTLWRLRAPRADDAGPKIIVKTDANRREGWTPERVGADTQFQAGDRVRLTIESKRRGYLYIINGELFANGKTGPLSLIFPAPANQDASGRLLAAQFNQVGAGLLVDIPDQTEDYPYFKIEPRNADYAGELVLIIISPTPLEGLRLGAEQEIANVDLLAVWEEQWGSEANVYEKEGIVGESFTAAEQQALCGAKARQLVRESTRQQNPAGAPCGAKERRLTREDPLPQSIYRVSQPHDSPLIVPVRLAVRASGQRR